MLFISRWGFVKAYWFHFIEVELLLEVTIFTILNKWSCIFVYLMSLCCWINCHAVHCYHWAESTWDKFSKLHVLLFIPYATLDMVIVELWNIFFRMVIIICDGSNKVDWYQNTRKSWIYYHFDWLGFVY